MEVEVEKIISVVDYRETAINSLGTFYHSWQYSTTMDILAETLAK